MVEAAQKIDSKKAEALFQRVDDLEKQLGPEYHALFDALLKKCRRPSSGLPEAEIPKHRFGGDELALHNENVAKI